MRTRPDDLDPHLTGREWVLNYDACTADNLCVEVDVAGSVIRGT